MDNDPGDWVLGPLMVVFAFLGLILAAGARDAGMEVFGFSLLIFAILFVFDQIRRHYDRAEARRAAGGTRHG